MKDEKWVPYDIIAIVIFLCSLIGRGYKKLSMRYSHEQLEQKIVTFKNFNFLLLVLSALEIVLLATVIPTNLICHQGINC